MQLPCPGVSTISKHAHLSGIGSLIVPLQSGRPHVKTSHLHRHVSGSRCCPCGHSGRHVPPHSSNPSGHTHAQLSGFRMNDSGQSWTHSPRHRSVCGGQSHWQLTGLNTSVGPHVTHLSSCGQHSSPPRTSQHAVGPQHCSPDGQHRGTTLGGCGQSRVGSAPHAPQRFPTVPIAAALLHAPRPGPGGNAALQKCAHALFPPGFCAEAFPAKAAAIPAPSRPRPSLRAPPRVCPSSATARERSSNRCSTSVIPSPFSRFTRRYIRCDRCVHRHERLQK